MPACGGHNILLFTVYFLLSTAAKPLPFRDHVHKFRVEAFGVVVLFQAVVQ